MNSSVADKIGKEGKSRKHASDEPVDVGVGSVPEGSKGRTVARGKRKDRQLQGKKKKRNFVRNKVSISKPTRLYTPDVIRSAIKARNNLKRFMELAVEAYKGTDAYEDDCGGQGLEDMQMVEAIEKMFNGGFKSYYITFTAKGSKDGLLRRYLAHVKRSVDYNAPPCSRWVDSIDFVKLKKDQMQE